MELAHYQEYANVLLVGLAIAVKKVYNILSTSIAVILYVCNI